MIRSRGKATELPTADCYYILLDFPPHETAPCWCSLIMARASALQKSLYYLLFWLLLIN